MLMFEVSWESEIIKFEMFKEPKNQIDFSKYKPKLFEEGLKLFVKILVEEILMSEKIPPPNEKK